MMQRKEELWGSLHSVLVRKRPDFKVSVTVPDRFPAQRRLVSCGFSRVAGTNLLSLLTGGLYPRPED